MCIKKVELFQGLDGGHYPSEREAIINSIAFLVESSCADVQQHIVAKLDRLLPLLHKLHEPRNQPRPAPLQMKETGAEPDALGDGEEYGLTSLTFVDDGVGLNEALTPEWGAGSDLALDDLRNNQIVEVQTADYPAQLATIYQINEDMKPEPSILGHLVDEDGKPLENMPSVHALLSEIVRVVKQPEERMSLSEAQRALAELEDEGVAPDPKAANQRHKSRILLHRRIADLGGQIDDQSE